MTNVVVGVPRPSSTAVVDLTSSTVLEPSTQEMDLMASSANLLDNLGRQAEAYGVGPSEWYEVKQRPLQDILAYLVSLRTPRSGGAASSS